MNHKMIVIVKPTGEEEYRLKAFIADAEDGEQLHQEVLFRDMGQVRSYYNGWSSAMLQLNARDPVVMRLKGWPYRERSYEVPVNFEYRETETV